METYYNGDCLVEMQRIPDHSADLVLVDLPYGTTACAWDSVIALPALWEAYTRLCTETATLVFTAVQPFATQLIASKMEWFRYEWIWEKPQGTNPLNAKFMPMKAHEQILVFYQKRGIYNPQMGKGIPVTGFSAKPGGSQLGEVYGQTPSLHRANPDGTRYPRSVLKFAQDRTGLHPTQKPVPLMQYLIRTYTNPGQTVLDNTMGSGTTGVAAVREERNFIGIEQDVKYFTEAKLRIENSRGLFV